MKRVKIQFRFGGNNCKVSAIKAIRKLTGMGLKESKDFVDPHFVENLGSVTFITSLAHFGAYSLDCWRDVKVAGALVVEFVEELAPVEVTRDFSMNGVL